MEKIRELLGKPLITAVLGFVLGLIIGLPILGWGLWPVKWVDASAEHLRADLRADYLRMAVQSFGQRPDEALALQRFKELGDKGSEALAQVAAAESHAVVNCDCRSGPDDEFQGGAGIQPVGAG